MAIAAVQHITATEVANSASSTGTFGSATGSGILVVVEVQGWHSGGFACPASSVTDNKLGSYAQAATGGASVGNNENSFIHYAKNVSGGAGHQVTVAPNGAGNNYFGFTATEVSSADTTSPLDVTAGAASTNATDTSFASGNLSGTTAQNDEIEFAILAGANDEASITVGVVSPTYTKIFENLSSATEVGAYYYRVLTATTNVGVSWSWPTGSRWSTCVATFKGAAGAPAFDPSTQWAEFGGIARPLPVAPVVMAH